MAPFHAVAELKQTGQAKILMSQILIRKQGHQIGLPLHRQIGLPLNSLFF